MPSLRNLLDTADLDNLGFDTGTAPAWQRQEGHSLLFQAAYGMCCYNNDYNNNCWCYFCVCNGMDIVTFELWGAGGGGAGACCCAWGPPGGSGAYTRLTVDNTSNGYSRCYCMCVAATSCCSPVRSCGYRGCKTYLGGGNICNLCAEGGRPGCSFCNFYGCFPNEGCGVLEHPCNTECACYFGCGTNEPGGSEALAVGVPGRHGWLQTDCNSPGDFCWYKVAFPIPPGLGTEDVSYKMVKAGCNVRPEYDKCWVGGWAGDGAHGGTNGVSWPVGVGGNTARVCGGGCCCGWGGGPGLIRISWT